MSEPERKNHPEPESTLETFDEDRTHIQIESDSRRVLTAQGAAANEDWPEAEPKVTEEREFEKASPEGSVILLNSDTSGSLTDVQLTFSYPALSGLQSFTAREIVPSDEPGHC